MLKNAQHMVITLKDVGILPHGKRIHDETRWIRDDERAKMSPRFVLKDLKVNPIPFSDKFSSLLGLSCKISANLQTIVGFHHS